MKINNIGIRKIMNFETLPISIEFQNDVKTNNSNFYTYTVGVKDVMLRSEHQTLILLYQDSVIFLNEMDMCETKEEEQALIKEFMSYYE